MVRRAWLVALAVGVAFTASTRPAAGGQQSTAASTAALARSADTIVLGSCDAGVSSWSDDSRVIVTRHLCHVEQAFKGQPSDTLTVQVLGGRVGDIEMGSSASISLSPGADVVLLLRRSQFGSYHVVAGGADGVLSVSAAPQRTVRGMSLSDFAHWVAAEAAQ